MPDIAFRLQVLQRSELVFDWNIRMDSMQLIQVNSAQAQPAQAYFACGPQMLWISVFDPTVGTRPLETALCGDHQVGRIGVQSLGYNLLTHARTVGVCGIDEIDPQFDNSPQDPDSLNPIRRLTPNSLSRNSHGPKS